MKYFLVTFLVFGIHLVTFSQINQDWKTIYKKGIRELSTENGYYRLKFDPRGYLYEIVSDSSQNGLSRFGFDENGDWVNLEELKFLNGVLVYSKRVEIEHDTLGRITNYSELHYDWKKEKCVLPNEISIYNSIRTDNSLKWINTEMLFDCNAETGELDTLYAEEWHESITYLSDTLIEFEEVDFYDGDTIGRWRVQYLLDSEGRFQHIKKWKDGASEPSREYMRIAENRYVNLMNGKQFDRDEFNYTDFRVGMLKEDIYYDIPRCRIHRTDYNYSIIPWEIYKKLRRKDGKNSVKIVYY